MTDDLDPTTAFADLPRSDFPFVMRLVDVDTGQVVWETTVSGPGALRVPGLAETGARAVRAEVRFPDGRVLGAAPDRPDVPHA